MGITMLYVQGMLPRKILFQAEKVSNQNHGGKIKHPELFFISKNALMSIRQRINYSTITALIRTVVHGKKKKNSIAKCGLAHRFLVGSELRTELSLFPCDVTQLCLETSQSVSE